MTNTNKLVALLALGLVLVAVTGCGGKDAAPAPTTTGDLPAGGEQVPADAGQEVDNQLADEEPVEIGEIV